MMRWRYRILVALLLVGAALVVFLPSSSTTAFKVGVARSPGLVEPQIRTSWDSVMVLAPDGTMWCWGGGIHQLTGLLPKPTVTGVPVQIGSDADWMRIASCHNFGVALKLDGTLWGWGGVGGGQLSSIWTNHLPAPKRLSDATDWSDVKAGSSHVLALKRDGTLWSWGQNNYGQTGCGTNLNFVSTISRVGDSDGWKAIDAGAFNSYGLRRDGTLWGWGLDPLSGGRAHDPAPRQLAPATLWTAISAGEYHLAAIRADGTLWVYGQNAHVVAGDFATASATNLIQVGTDSDWQEVGSGQNYLLARKTDGSWWGCGSAGQGQLLGLKVSTGATVKAPQRLPFVFDPWSIGAGSELTVAMLKDGTVWSWGSRPETRRSAFRRNPVSQFFKEVARLLGSRDSIVDFAPHRVWEIPGSSRTNPPPSSR